MKLLQTIAVGVGGAGALYYGPVGWELYTCRNEESRILRAQAAEISAAAAADAKAQQEQLSSASLEKQATQHNEALAELEASLDIALKKVEMLRGRRDAVLKEAAEATAAVEQARSRIATLVTEAKRRRENATMAEQSLAAARMKTREVDGLLNPLNHPLVKSLMSK